MPFLTEEIWQRIAPRTPKEALVIAKWPEVGQGRPRIDTVVLILPLRSSQGYVPSVKIKNIAMKEELGSYGAQ